MPLILTVPGVGDVLAEAIANLNGVALGQPGAAQRIILSIPTGPGTAIDLTTGPKIKALSLPFTHATDDPLWSILPLARGPGGGLLTEGSLPSNPDRFISIGGQIYNKSLKTTAATLCFVEISKLTAGTIFVRLYNKSSAPATVAPFDTPQHVYPITGPTVAPVRFVYDPGEIFTSGMGIRITAGAADSDATPIPTSNDVFVNTGLI